MTDIQMMVLVCGKTCITSKHTARLMDSLWLWVPVTALSLVSEEALAHSEVSNGLMSPGSQFGELWTAEPSSFQSAYVPADSNGNGYFY